MERLIDHLSGFACSPAFITVHVLWFVVWIVGNATGLLTFDRAPFNLLALAVSLEAIVLAGFVLMAQHRMTHQVEQRAHLEPANQFARGARTHGDAETAVSSRGTRGD